jgi:hypothetical protein
VTAIHVKNYCGARTKQRDGTCEQPAGWGTPHPGVGRCRFHGGSSPNAIRAGEVALVERDVRQLFGKIVPGIAPVENPLEAYAELAGRVLAWMQLMDSLLGDLKEVSSKSEWSGEQVRPVIELYERSMDRANIVLGSYARLRIDERLAEITEKQKLTVIRAIEAGLDEAGLSDEARADARRRVARHLRIVPAEAA